MALVKWAKGIEFVSGLLASRPKKGQAHADHENTLLATRRVAETNNPNCTRLYIREADTYNRTTPLSARELELRGRFDAVSKAVAVRAKDLMKISSDQAAFLAQKDQPDGKKTMKSYLWKVCGDEWDQAHGN